MAQFEYVMVLISIIIGLGIAHQLLGLAGIVDRLVSPGRPLGLNVAHLAWLGVVFSWTVMFWWWEFRFAEFVTEWTIGLYFFLVLYAVALFLLAALLVPQSWDEVHDLGHYFVERRTWFYSLLFAANGLDIVDTWLKGGVANLQNTPAITYAIWGAIAVASVIGVRTKALRTHNLLGVVVFVLQVMTGFAALPRLGL